MLAMTKPFDLEGSAAIDDERKCDKMSFAYSYVAPFCSNNLHRSLCLAVSSLLDQSKRHNNNLHSEQIEGSLAGMFSLASSILVLKNTITYIELSNYESLLKVVGWIKHCGLCKDKTYKYGCQNYSDNVLQSAPANEFGQSTSPMGVLCSQSLVSCLSEEVHLRSVSQMGFRLVSMPKLLGEIMGRNQSLNPF